MARVLIVDDSMFMRKVLRDILTRAGHEVVGEADSGEVALKEIDRANPQLVTLDLVMPGMGGMEVLRRKGKGGPAFIVVSAVGQEAEINEALALGARDFLVKPFEEERVVKTVTASLRG